MNFCTLFDSNYLSRGLALYYSLIRHCKNFHLYIFAFDDFSCQILRELKLLNVTVISLNEFENEKLLKIKSSRSKVEYYWTCTPSVIYFCIKKYKLDMCTYVDADIYFFSSPSLLIKEMEEKSVLITKHNYYKKYDQSETSGIYCVQFVTFKNDVNGMKVLNWWKNACINWCFNRFEDGKYGDQKYLDDWTNRFEGVCVLKNEGGGVAPWNIQKYNFKKEKKAIIGYTKDRKTIFGLIFYHFHGMKIFRVFNIFWYSTTKNYVYDINKSDSELIYTPYFKEIVNIYKKLIIYDNFNFGLENIFSYIEGRIVQLIHNVRIKIGI